MLTTLYDALDAPASHFSRRWLSWYVGRGLVLAQYSVQHTELCMYQVYSIDRSKGGMTR